MGAKFAWIGVHGIAHHRTCALLVPVAQAAHLKHVELLFDAVDAEMRQLEPPSRHCSGQVRPSESCSFRRGREVFQTIDLAMDGPKDDNECASLVL
jgi:hypothetical protein